MNIPVLGSLFRSRDYLRQETELVIIVTPYIVHAIDPQPGGASGRQFQRRQRSADVAARPRQPHLFDFRRPATHARLFRPGGFHHRLTRTRKPMPSIAKESLPMSSLLPRRSLRPPAQLRGAVRRGGDFARRLRRQLRLQRFGSARGLPRALSDRSRGGADRPRRLSDRRRARPAVDRQHPRLRRTLPRVRRRADRHSRSGRRARPRRAGDRPDPPRAGRRRPARLRLGRLLSRRRPRTALRRSGWCFRV